MKPSELIKVLQKAVDAGMDGETTIYFDVEAQCYDYHYAVVDRAYYEDEAVPEIGKPMITLHENTGHKDCNKHILERQVEELKEKIKSILASNERKGTK